MKMRFSKIIFWIILILITIYSAVWYYLARKIVSSLNSQFSNQQIILNNLGKEDYIIKYNQISIAGFPFMMTLKIDGWKEENDNTEISYLSPIYVGYNFQQQEFYISYDGKINSFYKPVSHQFGAIIDIENYLISIKIPLNNDLFQNISKIQNNFELINYCTEVNISSGKVKFYNAENQQEFYNKEYETLKFSLKPTKKYLSLLDFLNNLPSEYYIAYKTKIIESEEAYLKVPTSLLYGQTYLPSGIETDISIVISTKSKTINELANDLDIKANFVFKSPKIDLSINELVYKGGINIKDQNSSIYFNSKLNIKEGAINSIFNQLKKLSTGNNLYIIAHNIIKNIESSEFKELENKYYDINLDMNSELTQENKYLEIKNLSIFTEKSGVKFIQKLKIKNSNLNDWSTEGIIFLQNYLPVSDFISTNIYKLDRFKDLSYEAKEIYQEVNKAFLKEISDHPDSTSPDLSLAYSFDSYQSSLAKLGTVRFDKLNELYQLVLLRKLIAKVGFKNTMIEDMKKIIPNLDIDSDVSKNVLQSLKAFNSN